MKQRTALIPKSGVYHVYSRGTEKRAIFLAEYDCIRFLERLGKYATENKVAVHRCCLMPNHFHMLVYCDSIGSLSTMMQRLLTAYTMYFNRRYERTGHLFESRFKSKPVETDRYYQQLV